MKPEYEKFNSIIESAITNIPLIILGSGASAAYGLPTMGELGNKIIAEVESTGFHREFSTQWASFKQKLEETKNLEAAIEELESRATAPLIKYIVEITWKVIKNRDNEIYNGLVNGTIKLPLAHFFYRIRRGNRCATTVLTTNYDKLAEYAADIANNFEFHNSPYYTGFSYGSIKNFDKEIGRKRFTVGQRRAVDTQVIDWVHPIEIWKVHGSIDWFFQESNQRIVALENLNAIIDGLQPLIVTPGREKYRTTVDDPYRAIIDCADKALEKANSFLTIGFGFRDEHIQPRFLQRIKERKTIPTVVISKQITSEAKKIFSDGSISNYVLIEEHETGTKVTFKNQGSAEEIILNNIDLWNFDTFVTEFTPINN
jgi:hypothetical protein